MSALSEHIIGKVQAWEAARNAEHLHDWEEYYRACKGS